MVYSVYEKTKKNDGAWTHTISELSFIISSYAYTSAQSYGHVMSVCVPVCRGCWFEIVRRAEKTVTQVSEIKGPEKFVRRQHTVHIWLMVPAMDIGITLSKM